MKANELLQIAGSRRADLLAPKANLPRSPVYAAPKDGSFASILKGEVGVREEVRFSAHALQRLADRNVSLSAEDKARIGRSLDLAASKGGRQTLVLLDNVALIANVPNRTVITATNHEEMGDLVFTNIDSAVVSAGK